MKLYCASCKLVVATVTPARWVKGTIALCVSCYERMKIADNMAKLASSQGREMRDKCNTPDVFKDLFDFFNKGHK